MIFQFMFGELDVVCANTKIEFLVGNASNNRKARLTYVCKYVFDFFMTHFKCY